MVSRMAASPTDNMPNGNSVVPLQPAKTPLMIGVVGDSGSGKSTLVHGFYEIFQDYKITEICLDDYHRYDRAERNQRKITALHPAANKLHLMAIHLEALRRGQPIHKPVYDHSTGTFGAPEWVIPGEVVIVHGLFTLFSPHLSRLFDLSVYLDPEPGLRMAWKIKRDTQRRGYTLAEVLRQIEMRRPDAAAYIEPQKANADFVVRFCRPPQAAEYSRLRAELIWQKGLPLPAAFEYTAGKPYLRQVNSLRRARLEINEHIDRASTAHLAEKIGHELPPLAFSQLGQVYNQNNNGQSLPLALIQVILAAQLLANRPDFSTPLVEKIGA